MATEKNKMTILVADDHPLMRKGLRQVLQADHAIGEILEAEDGQQVLDAIARSSPDIAVLDLDMPVKSGLDVLRELSGADVHTQFIVLTMYREEDMFNEAMDLGVRGYILKDSADQDILKAIKEVGRGEYYISPLISQFLIQRSDRIRSFRRTFPQIEMLTLTEQKILKLIAQNRTSREIGDLLHTSAKTVENHRLNIAKKLGLHGAHSLVRFAFEHKSQLS